MSRTQLQRLTGTLGVILLGGWLAPRAQAHPHVWVVTETTVLYDNGTFVGIRHKWTFDEFYTAMAIEGLDKNNDGKYDRGELAELAKVNIEGLQESSYFTFPVLAGQQLKVRDARDYWLEHKDGILSLHFTVPFAHPVLAEAKGLTFSIYDPSYFIAFELAKTDPVRFSEGTPASCSIKVVVHDGEEARSLGEALQRQFGAFAVASSKAVSVECGDP